MKNERGKMRWAAIFEEIFYQEKFRTLFKPFFLVWRILNELFFDFLENISIFFFFFWKVTNFGTFLGKFTFLVEFCKKKKE